LAFSNDANVPLMYTPRDSFLIWKVDCAMGKPKVYIPFYISNTFCYLTRTLYVPEWCISAQSSLYWNI